MSFKFPRNKDGSATTLISAVGIITLSALAVVSFYFQYDVYQENKLFCYLAAFFAAIVSFMTVWAFKENEIRESNLLIILLFTAADLIVFFAGIYRGFGLKGNDCIDWSTALYFSAVTWTTLGYGDYQPKPELHLVAAFQAILGYLHLGLIVAILANLIKSSKDN